MAKRDTSKTVGRLAEAASDLDHVRLRRRIKRADRLDGFVVGLGHRWVLLRLVDNAMHLDGFAAVRIRDIEEVKADPSGNFVREALEWRAQGAANEGVPQLDLDSDRGLITSAGKAYPLISIHIEYQRPDVCFIGTPVRVTSKSVDLHEVTPRARWRDDRRRWQYSDISRVEVGGGYEAALHAVAGPPKP